MWKWKPSWLIHGNTEFKPGKNTQGFLLLEIVLALPLLAFLAAAFLSVVWVGLQSYQQQANKAEAQYFSRTAMNTLDSDIKQCSTLAVLSWNILEIVSMPDKVLVYSLEDNQIYRAEYRLVSYGRTFVSKTPMSEKIESLEFQLLSSELVIITIESKYKDTAFTLKTASHVMPD